MAGPYTEAENREVAEIIKRLRTSRNLTQADLCNQASLSLYTVHRLERHDHVRPATMKAILEALGRFQRVPLADVQRIASIYRFDPGVLDPATISQGEGFESIQPATAKDLHLLLDRALDALGRQPAAVSNAMLAAITAMLSTLAGDPRGASGPFAKHHPPQRVGDHEVTVIEPLRSPEPSKAKPSKSG